LICLKVYWSDVVYWCGHAACVAVSTRAAASVPLTTCRAAAHDASYSHFVLHTFHCHIYLPFSYDIRTSSNWHPIVSVGFYFFIIFYVKISFFFFFNYILYVLYREGVPEGNMDIMIYNATQARATPYLCGILLGFYLFKNRNQKNNISKVNMFILGHNIVSIILLIRMFKLKISF
jgi:hypothetical protein